MGLVGTKEGYKFQFPLSWNVQNNWSSIIFSDETKSMLGRNGKSMFGGSPTKVFGPTVLASWTTLRKPAVKEGSKFQFPLSTDLLVKRHDMARCPPGKSKRCQKSA
jgi:hypothetical protein